MTGVQTCALPISVPVWLIVLSDQLQIVALVGRYPTNKLICRGPILDRLPKPLWYTNLCQCTSCGISRSFPRLSPRQGQVTHVLLTRSPLEYFPKEAFPFDLHVLGTPPAFVLSQDQTLHRSASRPRGRSASCERSVGGVGTPTTFRSASCPDGLATSTRGQEDAANRVSRSRETHWLLAHCSVLKVRAGPEIGRAHV